MSTYRSWYLSVAAFLLVAGPSPALAQKDGLKMVYAVWGDPGSAAPL